MAPLPPDARIGRVALRVTDLERSVAFYTGVIGLALHERTGAAASLGPAGGRVLLTLEADARAARRPRGTSGLFHVAILVPDRAALGGALGRLADRRWPLSGAADHLVSEALYLDDPDGLGIEICRDRPRDAWPVAGGEVLMSTEPLDLDVLAAAPGAQPQMPMPADTSVGHVHLNVPDLDAAEQFYCEGLGLVPTLRRYPGALFAAAGGYHHHLGLNVWAGRGAPPPPADAVGLLSFSIEAGGLAPRRLHDPATRVDVEVGPVA